MKIYVLLPDYDYEGFGTPVAAWNYKPSKEDLLEFFKQEYDWEGTERPHLEEQFTKVAASLIDKDYAPDWDLVELEMFVK